MRRGSTSTVKYMSECEQDIGAGVADLEVVEEVVAAERR
jgi:hypothetical protein